MPFALVFLGLIFLITGVKGTIKPLGAQIVKDFTGPGNFFMWFAAIGAVGAVGAIPQARSFSRVFMTLILVAMVIRNGGIFDQLLKAIQSGPVAPERTGAASSHEASHLMPADPGSLGNSAVGYAKDLAAQSIATSKAQTSDPAKNFGKVASLVTKLFGL